MKPEITRATGRGRRLADPIETNKLATCITARSPTLIGVRISVGRRLLGKRQRNGHRKGERYLEADAQIHDLKAGITDAVAIEAAGAARRCAVSGRCRWSGSRVHIELLGRSSPSRRCRVTAAADR